MSPQANARLFPLAGIAAAVLLIASLSLPWGGADFDFSRSLLSFAAMPSRTYSAWRLVGTWDVVVCVAAAFAIAVNLTWLAPRIGSDGSHRWVAAGNVAAGAVATFGVVATMADPPVPAIVDRINGLPGAPEIATGARYGIFVSLALTLTLIGIGVTQMVFGRRVAKR